MNFHHAVSNLSNPDSSFQLAKSLFMQHGFQIKPKNDHVVDVVGPGMKSTEENPLLGISSATLRLSANRIDLDAELGSVQWMQRFIFVFPFALCLSLAVLFFCIFDQWKPVMIAMLVYSLWLVLSPLLSIWIRKRTVRAIEVFLDNVANNG